MTSDRIKDILQKLGYKLTDCGNHWRTNALYRGGDNPTALQVYKDSGVWVDYVEGDIHSPFRALVEATAQTNDKAFLESLFGGYDFDSPTPPSASRPALRSEKVYAETILSKLLPHYKFYNDRGIGDEVLIPLKGGLATEGAMYQRFVFPIYNPDGCIHGFSGRDMANRTSSSRPKWKHLGKKNTWIYPFYVPSSVESSSVSEAIFSSGEVILVESIGDLLNLHQHGFRNVLVAFGTSLSSVLCCFLVSLGLSKVIIALNNDSGQSKNRGEIGAFKMYLKLLNFFQRDSLIINLPPKSDFGEMDSVDFSTWASAMRNLDMDSAQDVWRDRIIDLVECNSISKALYKKKHFS